jgi:hypothetical protein
VRAGQNTISFPRLDTAGARRSRRFNSRIGLSAWFVLDALGVRAVKRAEARAPAADSVTRRFVRSSLCRIFLKISRGIITVASALLFFSALKGQK